MEKTPFTEIECVFLTLLEDSGMDRINMAGMFLATKDKPDLMKEMILWMWDNNPDKSEIIPHLLEKMEEMGILGSSEQEKEKPTDSQ